VVNILLIEAIRFQRKLH